MASTLAVRVTSVVGVHALHAPPEQQPFGQDATVHWQTPLKHSKFVPQFACSAALGVEHTPLVALHEPWVWQVAGAGHIFGAPAVHTPAWHVSAVHALASMFEHATSSFLFG
ncbi:MAG: hypothetical protein ABUL62_33795 [Myxococcales bacterium]|jgi:hypothetical protein